MGLGLHRGWAEGEVSTHTQTRDGSVVPAPCPANLVHANPQAACVGSQAVLGTIRTTLAFGLFRSLEYATTNSSQVTSNVYEQLNGTQLRLVHSSIAYELDTSLIVQGSYHSWAQGNPGAMGNVVGAQVFLVLAFWLSTASWLLLVVGLHYTSVKRLSESRIQLSSYLLLSASACLFLCFSIWAGLPVRALTNICIEGADGEVACTQLLSATCNALLAEDPLAVCSSKGSVNKRAGVWAIIFLSWMVEVATFLFLGRLHEAIVMSDGTTPREPLLGDMSDSRHQSRSNAMPVAMVS